MASAVIQSCSLVVPGEQGREVCPSLEKNEKVLVFHGMGNQVIQSCSLVVPGGEVTQSAGSQQHAGPIPTRMRGEAFRPSGGLRKEDNAVGSRVPEPTRMRT